MSPDGDQKTNGTHEILDGCVVSEHTTATEVGTKLYEKGGNAVDAIVGTILAVETLCPYHSGIGGGGFALIRTPEGEHHALTFRGAAPVSLPHFHDQAHPLCKPEHCRFGHKYEQPDVYRLSQTMSSS